MSAVLEHGAVGWDDRRTVRYYKAFCRRHSRYRKANAMLAAHSDLRGGQCVLDLAAGLGHTAEAILPYLDDMGRILCVEPAAAMRTAGARRLSDPRICWKAACPATGRFDRIVCGAAFWQLRPLEVTCRQLAGLLAPGGALCFNVPALYLGVPDEPGGGQDPWLLQLPARLAEEHALADAAIEPLPDPDEMEALLMEAGLRPKRWAYRLRITQDAYRDWLKIPVLTNGLLPDLDPDQRARRLDQAFQTVDAASWRWERWLGWIAWAPK
jgi:SAM-dependent methyltransferase